MRWSTTLGAWTRREALLVSRARCRSSDRRAGGPARCSVARGRWPPWSRRWGRSRAPVIAARRGALERERENVAFARLVRVAVARVAQVDPTAIGVDRAQQQILPGAGVPAYQPRAVDGNLVAAVRAALDGSGPWIVVVHGPSKVGKSRSLFEALRVCDRAAPVDLVAPVDAVALSSLMTPGEGLRPGTNAAALWLDDLEPFLNSGVTWRTLCEWHAGAPGRIAVATYGGKGSELIADRRPVDLRQSPRRCWATRASSRCRRPCPAAPRRCVHGWIPVKPQRLHVMDWRRISLPGPRLSASSARHAMRRARTPVREASRWSTLPSTGHDAGAPTRSVTTRCATCGRRTFRLVRRL